MYFAAFPYTYYSLDDRASAQVVTNITARIKINDYVKNNLGLFDTYDVKDGETPELVADKFYGNPALHWLILHYNNVIDPRFDWVMSTDNLANYTEGKYANVNAIHHYEDADEVYTNGNVYLTSNVAFTSFTAGAAIINNTNTGIGYITSKISSSNVVITVTSGGFITGDQIKLNSNASIRANITATSTISGTAVTNYTYEDTVNESKRRIKILKSQYVDAVVKDFKKNLEL
jgi:hypothetical protein